MRKQSKRHILISGHIKPAECQDIPAYKTADYMLKYAKAAHSFLNGELFDGKLTTPYIDFIEIINANSDIPLAMFVKNPQEKIKPEISEKCAIILSMAQYNYCYKSKSLVECNAKIISTLLHEMIHQYCFENGIVDNENGLHTKAFAEQAEKHGLISIYEETASGKNYRFTKLDAKYNAIWKMLNADFEIA